MQIPAVMHFYSGNYFGTQNTSVPRSIKFNMKEQFLEKDDEYIDTFDVAVETHWRVNTLSNKAHTHTLNLTKQIVSLTRM